MPNSFKLSMKLQAVPTVCWVLSVLVTIFSLATDWRCKAQWTTWAMSYTTYVYHEQDLQGYLYLCGGGIGSRECLAWSPICRTVHEKAWFTWFYLKDRVRAEEDWANQASQSPTSSSSSSLMCIREIQVPTPLSQPRERFFNLTRYFLEWRLGKEYD